MSDVDPSVLQSRIDRLEEIHVSEKQELDALKLRVKILEKVFLKLKDLVYYEVKDY